MKDLPRILIVETRSVADAGMRVRVRSLCMNVMKGGRNEDAGDDGTEFIDLAFVTHYVDLAVLPNPIL